MIDLKKLLAKILEIFTTEIFIGNITNDVKLNNWQLDTSSSDSAWLQTTLQTICQKYPNKSGKIFKGMIQPNSLAYFEVCIYDTNDLVNGLPRYCHGTWRHWQNTFAIISTNGGTFSYVAK